jgi:hypothetical protein
MERVLQSSKLPVVDYTVIPIFASPPFYCLVVESESMVQPEIGKKLAHDFEGELIRGNISYAGKLASQLIAPLRLVSVPTGTFENFLKYWELKTGAPYSQIKIGHLNPISGFLEYLKKTFVLPDEISALLKG